MFQTSGLVPISEDIDYNDISFDDQSCILESINFLIEDIQVNKDIMINLMHEIYEDVDNKLYIHEAVGNVWDNFKEWISKILSWIGNQIDRFFLALAKWWNGQGYVRSKLDVLRQFTDRHTFAFKDAYYFSFPDTDRPEAPLAEIRDRMRNVAMNLDYSNKNINKLIEDLKSLNRSKEYQDTEGYLARCRGEILNTRAYYSESNFKNVLKCHFRSKWIHPGTVIVNKQFIDELVEYVENNGYKRFMIEVRRNRKEVSDIYTVIQNYIATIKSKIGVRALDVEHEDEYDRLFTIASNYLFNMINLTKIINRSILMYFSAKLDAIRDMTIQNNTIGYKAIMTVMNLR